MNDESSNRSGSEAEHWKRIDRLLEEALERDAGERATFLEKACGGDAKLRAEVEELLAAHDGAGSFLASPAVEVAAKGMAKDKAGSLVGRRLGPYEVQALLGAGGMGEVYRARDTRLDRTVALKVLPPEFAPDEERMRRFRREAKAASALSHPNVATIHDVGDSDGIQYIVMEYVEGKTLDELIGRKGMRLNEALKYGVQIADALATAHEAGIVHRDLKPGNLMVTGKGQVKVLDFGLAKLKERVSFGHEESTATVQPSTEEGKIVGTVAYMSPEQAEGKPVDTRSDIFSFGSVLYEMVTGRRAFQGETPSSTLAAILRDNPRLASEVVETLPKEVERLINRCLRKDPERRIQHMDDVKLALAELMEEHDSGQLQAAPSAARRVVSLRLVFGAVAVVALIAAGWYWLSSPRPAEPEAPMVPVPFTSYPGMESTACFSPDGSQVVFAWYGDKEGNWDIYIKQVGGETARRVTTDPRFDGFPRWSPDGQSIAFLRSLDDARTAVILISPNGGRERQVAELPTLKTAGYGRLGLCWHPSGKYLAVVCDQAPAEAPFAISLLSPETGEKRLLFLPPKPVLGDNGPAFSPDGRSLAFCRHLSGSQLYLLQVSQGILPEGEPKQLTFSDEPVSSPVWTSDGREIIYAYGRHRSALWRIPASGRGTPKPLPFSGESAFDPANSLQNHRLTYTLGNSDIDIWRCEIPRAGEHPGPPSKLIATTQTEHLAQYSPDGKEIAYVSWSSGTPDIWSCDSTGSNFSQLTHLGGPEPQYPRWSPDGRRIIFGMLSGKSLDLFLIPAAGEERSN